MSLKGNNFFIIFRPGYSLRYKIEREKNDNWKIILSSCQQLLHFIVILGHPGVYHVPSPYEFVVRLQKVTLKASGAGSHIGKKPKVILPLTTMWVWVTIVRKSRERVSQRWYSMTEGPWREVLVLVDLLGCVLAPPWYNERVGGKHRFAAGTRHPWTP